MQFFSVLLSTPVCSHNINKQNVNIADETIPDCSFLSRYHYTKSKNYLKDYIEFVTEIPCLLGHPVECCRCLVFYLNNYMELFKTVPAYFID